MARFSPSDLDAVREAVSAAEGRTSGEIVPYIVDRSGAYERILWRGAALGAVIAVVLMLIGRLIVAGWSMPVLHSAYAPHAAALLGAGVGLLLIRYVPSVFRLVAGKRYLDHVVHQRAMRAFLEEQVFDTRDRTGIVILVSLLERRIEVLGDAGINAAVEKEEWADVVAIIRDGLKNGQPADALVKGIERCGEFLREHGVERRSDDSNELPDEPRISPT